jgi:hypothetical protein
VTYLLSEGTNGGGRNENSWRSVKKN